MTAGRAAGLLMGAYHFAYADLNPALTGTGSADSEATNFVNFAGPYITAGYLRPVLDVESTGCGSLTSAALSAWVGEWMQKVTALTGVQPIIYTDSSFAASYLNSSLTKYNIWIAAWDNSLTATPTATPWSTWNFWQYGGTFGTTGVEGATMPGIIPGQVYNGKVINGNVDVDEFNGILSALSPIRDRSKSRHHTPNSARLSGSPQLNDRRKHCDHLIHGV